MALKTTKHAGRARRIGFALAVGAVIHVFWWSICHSFVQGAVSSPAIRQVVFDLGLVAIALCTWRTLGFPFGRMGLRRPSRGSQRWQWYAGIVVVMGVGAACAVALDVSHPVVSALSPAQIVVVVWLFGSTAEEVFIRGFVQSLMYIDDVAGSMGRADVIASGAFFAAIHIPLYWTPMRGSGVSIVLVTALAVGCLAAEARKATGSIVPAIMLHVMGNVVAPLVASAIVSLR